MPRRRIRVLTDDQHPHLVERKGEGAQNILTGRQIAPAGGEFGAQELPHLRDVRPHRLERAGPAVLDKFIEGACTC